MCFQQKVTVRNKKHLLLPGDTKWISQVRVFFFDIEINFPKKIQTILVGG